MNTDRYRWHDLKENPKDLPKRDDHYLCKCEGFFTGYVVIQFTRYLDDEPLRWIEPWFCYAKDIVAWKEIEPYEVKE